MPYIISTNKTLGHIMGEILPVSKLTIGDICSAYPGPICGFDTLLVTRANTRAIVFVRLHLAMAGTRDLEDLEPLPAAGVTSQHTISIAAAEDIDGLDETIDPGTRLRRETVVLPRDATHPSGGPLMFYMHQRIHRH